MNNEINKVINNEDLIRHIFSFLHFEDLINNRLVSSLFNKNINKAKIIIDFFERNYTIIPGDKKYKEYKYYTPSTSLNPQTGYLDDYFIHCKFKYTNYLLPFCHQSLKYCINRHCLRKTHHNGVTTKSPVVGNIYLQYSSNNNNIETDHYEYYNLHNLSIEFSIYNISNNDGNDAIENLSPIYHKNSVPVIQRFIPYCFECMVCYC